jgi:transcription elongation factor GreA-like protein/transcription elongation GreA/GreB family factor
MGYLEEFQEQIINRDFSKFLQLWEEYVTSDTVDPEEFKQLLLSVKSSDLAKQFGQLVETALPLWETIQEKEASYLIMKLLIDLQTTNSSPLAEAALTSLKQKYEHQPTFNERLRLIGMRSRESFQGALSNYDLLDHVKKGHFVFHTGGWGAGEIMEISSVREQLTIEFEHVTGRKHITFLNAFKTLQPLSSKSFLARRFSDADNLEKEARDNPVTVVKLLLHDLGPKTAAEIKDELCDLVIPEKDWTKWWQGARAKLKKDTMIETPESLKECFRLRKAEVTHEERMYKAIETKEQVEEIIQTAYSFVRDHPHMLKNPKTKTSLREKLMTALEDPLLTKAQELQIVIFFENQFTEKVNGRSSERLISALENVEEVIDAIEIIAFKKRVMALVREHRTDWIPLFISLLVHIQQSPLRDYLLKELNQGEAQRPLLKKLDELKVNPLSAPEFFVWYFQKIISCPQGELPYSNKEGQCQFFEAFLILFSQMDTKPEYKDLSKKMYNILSGKRYAVVRKIIEGTSLEFIKEFLLLVSKCQLFTDHDLKILRSLAEVVHPSLIVAKQKKDNPQFDTHMIWTTEQGYKKIRDRIQQINDLEMVETAREIEAARALGDLRENSEYKFALEKRSRLQSEMKHLSDQLGRARIITKEDIHLEEVGIGSIVQMVDSKGNQLNFTILGPWDGDIDENILSFQSKFAQIMAGTKKGDKFNFKEDEYTIVSIGNVFDK